MTRYLSTAAILMLFASAGTLQPPTLPTTASASTDRPQGDTTVTTPPTHEIEFYKWALTQGGLVLVCLVLLWMYRKDLASVIAKSDEKIIALTNLIAATTAAVERQTAQSKATEKSLDHSNHTLDRLTNAVEDLTAATIRQQQHREPR